MPQMAPLWWTSLMVMFIILFMMTMTVLYFNLSNKMKSKITFNNNKMIWKW